jgi:hypothetical protein
VGQPARNAARNRAHPRLLDVVIAALIATLGLWAFASSPSRADSPPSPGLAAAPSQAAVGIHYAQVVPVCNAPSPGHAACLELRRIPATGASPDTHSYAVRASFATGPAGGYTPDDLASAYGLSPSGSGAGQTVAVVDAYDDPTVEADLGVFDAYYGLPACTTANGCFEKVGQDGSPTDLPRAADTAGSDSDGWDGEIALDVETVHSICPSCKVLLVEANSNGAHDLGDAADEAVALGATEVSNSYGAAEGGGVASDYDHAGVVITASAGDDGYLGWDDPDTADGAPTSPASLPTVVAVGGTSLFVNANGARVAESVWNDDTGPGAASGASGATGGGCSTVSAAPLWQTTAPGWAATGCGSSRLVADVSAVADPLTGFDTYDSYDAGGTVPAQGWATSGGTSLSAPLVAAIYALAGGARGVPYPAEDLYAALENSPGSLFDVTAGGNGSCDGAGLSACGGSQPGSRDCNGTTACDAAIGYDGPSGVGTPNGLGAFQPPGITASFTAPATAVGGTAVSFDASASTSETGAITSYEWTWGDGTAPTTTTGPQASHTYASAGSFTVGLEVTTGAGLTGDAATRTIAVSAPPTPAPPPTVVAKTAPTQTTAKTPDPPARPGALPAPAPPVLGGLSESRRCVTASALRRASAARSAGLTFSFTLSQAADVSFTVALDAGSRALRRCPAVASVRTRSATIRRRSAETAGTPLPAWALGVALADGGGRREYAAGREKVTIAQIVSDSSLRAGTYRLTLRAENAHGSSKQVYVTFRILR